MRSAVQPPPDAHVVRDGASCPRSNGLRCPPDRRRGILSAVQMRSDSHRPSDGVPYPSPKIPTNSRTEPARESYRGQQVADLHCRCAPGSCDGHSSSDLQSHAAVAVFTAPIDAPTAKAPAARCSSPDHRANDPHVSIVGGVFAAPTPAPNSKTSPAQHLPPGQPLFELQTANAGGIFTPSIRRAKPNEMPTGCPQ